MSKSTEVDFLDKLTILVSTNKKGFCATYYELGCVVCGYGTTIEEAVKNLRESAAGDIQKLSRLDYVPYQRNESFGFDRALTLLKIGLGVSKHSLDGDLVMLMEDGCRNYFCVHKDGAGWTELTLSTEDILSNDWYSPAPCTEDEGEL